MNGILIIDKPDGLTSHDVVARVRRILRTRRVGHTGTLDPFATGVMVILVGQATRLAQFLDRDEKEYEAVVRFGYETDTGDRTGAKKQDFDTTTEEVNEKIRAINWENVFSQFRGETEQTPPMYSAKKIDGKKLYEHARRGETIERKSVFINISELSLIEDEPVGPLEIKLRVACSAGTYVRTLAEDIGRVVGTGAHLSELRRSRAGQFDISQAISLESLASLDDPASVLLPLSHAVSHLPKFVLPDDRVEKTRNGLSSRVSQTPFADGESLRMQDSLGSLIAIGIYDAAENTVRPKVVLV